jgi:hypothetical protein
LGHLGLRFKIDQFGKCALVPLFDKSGTCFHL